MSSKSKILDKILKRFIIFQMRKILDFIFEISKTVILALLIVLPIRLFLFQPFLVQGISMEPNFLSNDYLIVEEVSKRFKDFQRGDVVVFSFQGRKLIKRIVGLPGEKVEISDGKVKINGKILDESAYLPKNSFTVGEVFVTLEKDEFFVLGDNRSHSFDSRVFGPIKRKDIVGKVAFKIPFSKIFHFVFPRPIP